MNRFVAPFFFSLVLGASPLGAQAPDPKPLTLDQAVQAVRTNPLVTQAQTEVSAARSLVAQAQGAFLPTLDTSASWQRALPQQQQNTGAGYVAATPLDYWDLTLGVREVIWDFGKRQGAVTRAQGGARSAAAGARQTAADLTYQTVRAFWSVVFLKEELGSLEEQRKDLVQHLNAVQLKAGTGSGTKYDVLNTQVRVTSLEGQKIETNRQLTDQRLLLGRLVGAAPETWEVDGHPGVRTTARSQPDLVGQALGTRAEIEAARAAAEGAEGAVQSALARWTPDLSASVAAGFQNPLLTQDNQDLDRPMLHGTVGLTLSLSGLNPAQVAGQADEARFRLDEAWQNLASTRDEVASQVERAFAGYQSSLSAWDNAREQSGQARQAVEAASLQYDLGVISNDTYLNSHLAYEQARLSELRVLFTQMAAYFGLAQAVGVEPDGL